MAPEIINTPGTPEVAPAPEPQVVEAPVDEAPKFKVTPYLVTILNGGGNFIYTGHQSTHRVHVDANGVEHIYWNRVMQPLPTLNVHITRRELVKGS